MIKENQGKFIFLQKFADLLGVSLCWFLAYYVRFGILSGGQQGLEMTFLKVLPGLLIISSYFYHKNHLYRSMRFSSRYIELSAVMKANTQATLALVVLLYFVAPERLSRLTILNYYLFAQFFMSILRITVRNYLRHIRKKGRNLRHILIVGNGKQIEEYLHVVRKYKDAGIRIIGWHDSGLEQHPDDSVNKAIPLMDDDNLLDLAKKLNPDVIVFGYSTEENSRLKSMLKLFANDYFSMQVLPEVSISLLGNQIENFEGVPLVHVNQPHLTSFDILLKRLFDFSASLIGLIIISPILTLIAIAVKLSSPGPILFGQVRVGLDGKEFTMWKFRSMRMPDKNEDDTEWSNKENPRKTKVGDFLRKTSLDELPQLFNVLIGQMSLVGPRPERPFFVDKFKNEIPNYMLRHKLPPGITGWAQINGWRGDTSIEKRIECDIDYIKKWSFWLDIKILFLTFIKGFVHQNAY